MQTKTSFGKSMQQFNDYLLGKAAQKNVAGGGTPLISCTTCTPGSPTTMPAVTTVVIRF